MAPAFQRFGHCLEKQVSVTAVTWASAHAARLNGGGVAGCPSVSASNNTRSDARSAVTCTDAALGGGWIAAAGPLLSGALGAWRYPQVMGGGASAVRNYEPASQRVGGCSHACVSLSLWG